MNFKMFKLDLEDRGTRNKIANIIERAGEFQKNIYFCFLDYAKAFDCVDHDNLWKILQEMGIPDHLTRLLKNPIERSLVDYNLNLYKESDMTETEHAYTHVILGWVTHNFHDR